MSEQFVLNMSTLFISLIKHFSHETFRFKLRVESSTQDKYRETRLTTQQARVLPARVLFCANVVSSHSEQLS